MKTIRINHKHLIPENFTGIAEFPNGEKHWFKEGKFHREDGPAREFSDGTKYWYKEGLLHRLDGPAVEYPNGYKEWYKEGKLHRLDGPAVESSVGTKSWYLENIFYSPKILSNLINSSLFLGKEKGQYGL